MTHGMLTACSVEGLEEAVMVFFASLLLVNSKPKELWSYFSFSGKFLPRLYRADCVGFPSRFRIDIAEQNVLGTDLNDGEKSPDKTLPFKCLSALLCNGRLGVVTRCLCAAMLEGLH